MNIKKYVAEFIGTAVLVLMGCGTAVFAGESYLIIAIAFGLSIVAMAYAIGSVSGCHINPAVSLAMLINKKISILDFFGYIVAQVLGAFAGSGLVLYILTTLKGSIAENGIGANMAGDLGVVGALVVEVILTFIFVYAILGVTSDEKNSNIAGLVIGFTLTFVHILGIPLTGTSVNPARSIAPAIFAGGDALADMWIFIVAPLVGAAIAAVAFKLLNSKKSA